MPRMLMPYFLRIFSSPTLADPPGSLNLLQKWRAARRSHVVENKRLGSVSDRRPFCHFVFPQTTGRHVAKQKLGFAHHARHATRTSAPALQQRGGFIKSSETLMVMMTLKFPMPRGARNSVCTVANLCCDIWHIIDSFSFVLTAMT